MSTILRAVIDHHIWANDTLVGFCETLTPEQLALAGPGTYGDVHDTLVHLADAEVVYLSRIPESGIALEFEGDTDTLPSVAMLRTSLRRTGEAWHRVVDRWPDDFAFTYRTREGDEERKTVSFSVVQMLDHGAEHRNHIRTILSSHGIEPPEIDGWLWDEERTTIVP
jgi:uncharacterized damage-inducible protein DinB